MKSYLVEAYTPVATGMDALEARFRDATDSLGRSGTWVRYVRSIYVPEDEICFHIFDAGSAEEVRRAADRAGLEAQRIVEAIPL